MSFSLITNGNGYAVGGVAANVTVDTTGADLLVVCMLDYISGTETMSDNKGNTWILAESALQGFTKLKMWYAKNPTVGTGHAFTGSKVSESAMLVSAWSGADLIEPLDQHSSHIGSENPIQPGSVTPSTDNQLLITQVGTIENSVWTINEGFTILNVANGHQDLEMADAYLIQTTATAQNPSWDRGGASSYHACLIASFKAAPTGPVLGLMPQPQMLGF